MSSLDIAPCPEGAPISGQDQCRTRRRRRVSFRRAGICTFWRLGFRQSSFHHIARVSRHTVPDTWTRSPVSWHALVPLTFQRRVSHQTHRPPSNPSQLGWGYNEAPRGALRSCREASGCQLYSSTSTKACAARRNAITVGSSAQPSNRCCPGSFWSGASLALNCSSSPSLSLR
jgi:hypothetical protein